MIRGADELDKFKGELAQYLNAQLAAKYNGQSAPKVVLFSPIAHENLKHPDFTDGEANNANLALYTKAMEEVAKAKGVPFVDLFTPSRELFAKAASPLTINGIHLTEEGDRQLAPVQFKAVFGTDAPDPADPLVGKIRAAVIDKNTEWHHRYRTVDQFNIYGDRSRIAYEGVTNAVTLGQEMAQRDVKTANRDLRVWAVAKGGDLAVTDDNLPTVALVPPNSPPSPTGSTARPVSSSTRTACWSCSRPISGFSATEMATARPTSGSAYSTAWMPRIRTMKRTRCASNRAARSI